MYYDEHNPPHFHATYGEFKAEISINELNIIVGKLPPRVLGLIIEWAALHRPELMQNWGRIEKGEPIQNILPLE